ncbi:MAG: agmatine deiminase family protein [Chitinophagaceae bacterium]|nr:agmatine deiminase family protein [Chitinophagaceae bacterium]
MKKLNYLIYFILLALLYSCSQKNKTEFYLPAEWETQMGVIVNGLDDTATFEMVSQLARETKVFCLISDSTKEMYQKKLASVGVNLDSIQFLTSSTEFSYAQRDGIIFLKNGIGEKKLVNFGWNMYGWYFDTTIKNYIDKDKIKRELYNSVQLKAFPYPVITSFMVNEGGAIETNGKGTILQVESVNMQRNPTMSKELQEAELKKVLNVKKIIWLKEGAAEDPFGYGTLITENYFGIGVKGHLDEFCRFVNENTILISFPDSIEAAHDPVKKITLDRMKINYEILKNATDQDGKPFTIIKMPVPDIDYMTFALDTASKNNEIKFLSQQILYEQKRFSVGDTVHFVPSSSYLNFLITNKTIFEAKYWSEGQPESSKAKDEMVKQILQQYFPEKRIYQINTAETNHHGGGLHCWSMQVPK